MARPLEKFALGHKECWDNMGIKFCEKEVKKIFVSEKIWFQKLQVKSIEGPKRFLKTKFLVFKK